MPTVALIVPTDERCTVLTQRTQRERLVEELKGSCLLHERHVEMGKRSIHVKGAFLIDVVCLNTEEFGRRPLADERFSSNIEACSAVR